MEGVNRPQRKFEEPAHLTLGSSAPTKLPKVFWFFFPKKNGFLWLRRVACTQP
jgi:hypothetical protein